jgi:hypothetical protein
VRRAGAIARPAELARDPTRSGPAIALVLVALTTYASIGLMGTLQCRRVKLSNGTPPTRSHLARRRRLAQFAQSHTSTYHRVPQPREGT